MKTILITGSTDGIGKQVAAQLAKEGHEILLHGRSLDKLNNTINEIKDSSNNDKIKGFVADLSDDTAVQKMIRELTDGLTKIDVLINNAGVFKSPVQTNEKGLDLRFSVNYLAPFSLTDGVMPLLKNSSSPRVINLSSAAQSSVSLAALAGKEVLSTDEAYAQSKLALTMWSFDLAQQFEDAVVIAVNPGSLLNTKMAQEAYGQFWHSADKGANILYDLAVQDEFNSDSGKYFDNDRGAFSQAHPDAYDQEKIRALMAETKQILAR